MTLLIVCTAVIALLVAGVAGVCATVPDKRWMWSTPLWAAPIFLTLMLGFRVWLASGAADGIDPDAQARFSIACILTVAWLPGALFGWLVADRFARRGRGG